MADPQEDKGDMILRPSTAVLERLPEAKGNPCLLILYQYRERFQSTELHEPGEEDHISGAVFPK